MPGKLPSIKNFLNRQDGVTAIEYGLLAALIALVLAVGAGALGVNLGALFSAIAMFVEKLA